MSDIYAHGVMFSIHPSKTGRVALLNGTSSVRHSCHFDEVLSQNLYRSKEAPVLNVVQPREP